MVLCKLTHEITTSSHVYTHTVHTCVDVHVLLCMQFLVICSGIIQVVRYYFVQFCEDAY